MLQSAWKMRGFNIQATDGKIGRADDFYFDDISWTIRYLVVDTGSWLSEHEVLLSPAAVTGVDYKTGCIKIPFTKDYVKAAPNAESQTPVTRRWEAEYHDYFGWPYYWEGSGFIGVGPYPEFVSGVAEAAEGDVKNSPEKEQDENLHLQSARDVGGCGIAATNGEIGRVIDYIVDDETWVVRYVLVSTGSWLSWKKVLISTRLISHVDWTRASLQVPLTREAIHEAPAYDPNRGIGREYEKELFAYYKNRLGDEDLKPYWEWDQQELEQSQWAKRQ